MNGVTKRIEEIKLKHRKQSLNVNSRIQSGFQNQNITSSTGKITYLYDRVLVRSIISMRIYD